MSNICCRHCGSEIDGEAKACPNCGMPVQAEQIETTKDTVYCKQCGTKLSSNTKFCSNCGYPVSDIPRNIAYENVDSANNKKKPNKKTIIIIVVAAFLILLGCLVGINAKKAKEENIKKEYADNLELAATEMLIGAAKAEDAGNLIKSVWYNTIYEKSDITTDKYTKSNGQFNDDFNDSLTTLFLDADFRQTIKSIKDNQEAVKKYMKLLQDPPEEYKEAYAAIKELYTSYLDFTQLVISPSGSYKTFSDNFNTYDSNTLNRYNAIKIYIEE